jgi:hypothetical protein
MYDLASTREAALEQYANVVVTRQRQVAGIEPGTPTR